MDEMPAAVASDTAPRRRVPLLLLGTLLFLIGPIVYTVQVQIRYLKTPWYIPILSTIGLFLILNWVWQRRSLLRIATAIPYILLYAFMWVALIGLNTPQYRGPLQAPRLVPKFVTMTVEGDRFTEKDLQSGVPSVLVFFRGRW